MNALQLAWRVLRVDRRTRTSAILTAVGVAVATGLVLLLVSLPFATGIRAQRAVWQDAFHAEDGGAPSKVLLDSSKDYFNGKEITRIDVAALGNPDGVVLPAGMPKLPAPGETLVSPDLGKLMHGVPSSQLADRFGPKLVGSLTEDALSFPEQLVVVVGHNPADMPKDSIPAPGFASGKGQVDPELVLLSGVGIVVLMVPSLVLVASSARLTAARRERRLAAIRLAGATPGQVTGMVAAETSVSAVAGALLGLVISPALHGLATFVPWAGGTWQVSDFSPPVGLTVALVVAVPVLVVLAAAFGLRRVLKTPLGAVASHARKPLHWWRLLSLPVAGMVFLYSVTSGKTGGPGPVFLGLTLLVASAALVGPWVTSAVGGTFVRVWRKPAGLLAGRRLRDDPKGAYRASAGVVLAVFAGSMALTLLPSFESLSGGGRSFQDSVLYTASSPDKAAQIAGQTDATLAKYGVSEKSVSVPGVTLSIPDGVGGSYTRSALVLDCAQINQLTRFRLTGSCQPGAGVYSSSKLDLTGAQVKPDYDHPGTPLAAGTVFRPLVSSDKDLADSLVIDPAAVPASVLSSPDLYVTVAVPTTPANYESVRTALVTAAGGTSVSSRDLHLGSQQTQLDDLRRVTIIGLIAAAVLAGCSAAVATAGSVMDRRRTFGALIAAGTPVKVLARALRMEAALPALVATIGAGAVGVLVGVGLFNTADEGSIVLSPWVLAPVVLGIGVAVLAASVCTPALNRVRAEPLADE